MLVSYPGIGGSLGECVLCGETFATEIILGKSVPMIQINGMDKNVPIHEKCMPTLQTVVDKGGNWRDLPDGPLRREFEQVTLEEESRGR